MKELKDTCVNFYAQGFDKLYTIKTLITLTYNTCKELEFKGEYYGMKNKNATLLSSERNDYINMLEIISDNISEFMSIYNDKKDGCCNTYHTFNHINLTLNECPHIRHH